MIICFVGQPSLENGTKWAHQSQEQGSGRNWPSIGCARLPKSGKYVLASNHLDPLFVSFVQPAVEPKLLVQGAFRWAWTNFWSSSVTWLSWKLPKFACDIVIFIGILGNYPNLYVELTNFCNFGCLPFEACFRHSSFVF